MRKSFVPLLLVLLFFLLTGPLLAEEKADPLASWKPAFDPGGAQFTYILSNVSHPGIEGVGVGYRIRDKVWERSGGRLYVDFRPLAQLGGEKDVISKLKLGAVHGMLSSSVAAANVADTLGIVNLPYVIDTFDKLDKFRNTPELWQPFRDAALKAGIMVPDITGYGTYGWATTTPVRSLADAGKVNFRIAEAPVNADIYKAWGLKFTVMPWPDVPQALQTGVINGLDHTPIVCNITKKFDRGEILYRSRLRAGSFRSPDEQALVRQASRRPAKDPARYDRRRERRYPQPHPPAAGGADRRRQGERRRIHPAGRRPTRTN